jgi:hypothetical protein
MKRQSIGLPFLFPGVLAEPQKKVALLQGLLNLKRRCRNGNQICEILHWTTAQHHPHLAKNIRQI